MCVQAAAEKRRWQGFSHFAWHFHFCYTKHRMTATTRYYIITHSRRKQYSHTLSSRDGVGECWVRIWQPGDSGWRQDIVSKTSTVMYVQFQTVVLHKHTNLYQIQTDLSADYVTFGGCAHKYTLKRRADQPDTSGKKKLNISHNFLCGNFLIYTISQWLSFHLDDEDYPPVMPHSSSSSIIWPIPWTSFSFSWL